MATRITMILASALIAACASATKGPQADGLCVISTVDTTNWHREAFGRGNSVLLPPGYSRDTSAVAALTYYHGGGQWVGPRDTVMFYYVEPNSWPGVPPSLDTVPGVSSCFPIRRAGWTVRYAQGRLDGKVFARTWYRRPESTQRSLGLYAESADAAALPILSMIVQSGQPDSTLWAESK